MKHLYEKGGSHEGRLRAGDHVSPFVGHGPVRPPLPLLYAVGGRGQARMSARILELVRTGGTPKGDVLAVAQVAGIMAAKRTHELIPMCHPLRLTGIDIRFACEEDAVRIRAEVKCRGRPAWRWRR